MPAPRTAKAITAQPSPSRARGVDAGRTVVGAVINADKRVNGRLKVVFVPDYRVSLAEQIIPAANLSEQISTAGTEASGTGNMKLAMNGALTIGTLDGANIELRDAVGPENFFTFGLTRNEIQDLAARGSYRPRELCTGLPDVKRILDALGSDLFCPDEPGLLRWIGESLLERGDPYFHVADLPAYIDEQGKVDEGFGDQAAWATKAILNVARIGRFSCDRTVAEYARDIWQIERVMD